MAALALVFASSGGPAQAQVLQVEPDGSVTTFTGPAVFDAHGARPLSPPPPNTATGSVRRSAGAQDYRRAAQVSALSVDLIAAVAWRESRQRGGVVSRKGAIGEMQLMPATARALGVDPNDGAQNVQGGAAYLRALLRRYDGDLIKALAAYNAGTAAVDRYGGAPPYRETQAYVAAVLDRLSEAVAPTTTVKTARR